MALPPGALYRLGSVRLRDSYGAYDFTLVEGGQTLLTAGEDGILRYWDLDSGKVKRAVRIRDETHLLNRITLAPDGRFAMVEIETQQSIGNPNPRLRLYDVGSGREVKTIKTASWALSRELSPDGKYVAVATKLRDEARARLTLGHWATGTEREISLHYTNVTDSVGDVGRFVPNGKWFVVWGFGGEPSRIIDVATGADISRLGKWNIKTAAFSADSKVLVLSCHPGGEADNESCLRLLKMPGGELMARYPSATTFTSLALSNDRKWIAGSTDKTIMIDASNGQTRHQFPLHADKIQFTPDDKTLACLAMNRVHLFDVATAKEIFTGSSGFHISGEPTPTVSPDGKILAFLDRDGPHISLWDLPNRKLIRRLPISASELYGLHQLVFRDEGKRLSALGELGNLFTWNTATGQSEKPTKFKDRAGDGGHDWPKISTDGQFVETLHSPGRILGNRPSNKLRIHSAASGAVLHSFSVPRDWWSSQWLPGIKLILVRGQRDEFTFVSAENGAELARFKAPDTYKFLPSSDSRLLASGRVIGSKQIDLIIWERLTAKEVARLPVGSPGVWSDALFADNKSLIAANEHAIEVWDLATQQVRYRVSLDYAVGDVKTHLHVSRAILMPGDRELLTALSDGSALVWDISPAFKPSGPVADPQVDDKAVAQCWANLASDDARVAYQAIWQLESLPRTWPLVIERLLKEKSDPERDKVRELISQLDSDKFQVREKAHGELEKMGGAAASAMRDARRKSLSPETRRRLEQLLSRWPANTISPLLLRRLRAIQVLEFANDAESNTALHELVKSPVWEMEREEAQAALERLEKRSQMRR
jgi:WD40 repeat protein